MAELIEIAVFIDEEAEADWWANNQDLLLEQFRNSVADGAPGRPIPAAAPKDVMNKSNRS